MTGTPAPWHWLVDIQPGDEVVLLADAHELAPEVVEAGATPLRLVTEVGRPPRLPGRQPVAHVMAAGLRGDQRHWLPAFAAAALRPGGQLLLTMDNAASLFRWARRRPQADGALLWSWGACQRALGRAGLRCEQLYGIDDDLRRPQFWVPLIGREPARYFFEHLWVPYTRAARLARQAAPALIRFRLAPSLFRSLVVVARRVVPGAG